MKVLLINGSSRNNGCTGAALQEVERSLQEEGIETERFFIGNAALPDCIACRRCKETGRCVYHDIVNEFVEKAEKADGFVFGSPVIPLPLFPEIKTNSPFLISRLIFFKAVRPSSHS